MHRRKIVVACLSLILATLALSSVTTPKANAAVSSTVSLSGLGVSGFMDPFTSNVVDGISAGSTLTVTVAVLAPSSPSIQHNVTVGFKGDWMNSYQNASSANSGATLALTASQQATITISVTTPSTGGLTAYNWNVIVCDGPSNSKTDLCSSFTSSSTPYHPLAVYTSDQLSAAQASVQANSALGTLPSQSALLASGFARNPGASTAAGQIAQANTEISLGSQSWKNGDYSGAKTHYQNALNDANAAEASLANQGGGTDTANLLNLILGGTGIMLIGVGALLAGLGAFVHYIRKPKP
jgi:hypothetical protein